MGFEPTTSRSVAEYSTYSATGANWLFLVCGGCLSSKAPKPKYGVELNQGLLGEYGCNWGPTIRRSLAHRRDLNPRPFDTLVKGREPNTGREAKQAERPNKQGG